MNDAAPTALAEPLPPADPARGGTALMRWSGVELDAALAKGEFQLEHQPQFSLDTDLLVGFEALVRWDRPGAGRRGPAEFGPAAEDSGRIVSLGGWVLAEACRHAVTLQLAEPGRRVSMAVNMSARELTPRVAATVAEALAASGLEPGALCVELTETAVTADLEACHTVLRDLRGLGVRIALDDFGTGQATLQCLHHLPLDELKIDRSFVAGLGKNPIDTSIVGAVIALGQAIGLRVVAEGVETREQCDRLRDLGCDVAQGFFFASPMPLPAAQAFQARSGARQVLADGSAGRAGAGSNDVVVVDDDADHRALLRMSLRAAGMTIHEAVDGATGLAMARELRPACLLVDVSLPDFTGVDVCHFVRADESLDGTAIVMVSAYDDGTTKANAFVNGADDYVTKPFVPRDLTTRVQAAIRHRHRIASAPAAAAVAGHGD